jgi:hypothetical protein
VTHDRCIAILVRTPAGGVPRAEQDEARGHAARCSDCWGVLELLHELALGTPPAEAERMRQLFGCRPVQDDLYLLEDLTAEEMRRHHPALARHLGWCLACRERLAEVRLVARAAARGEFGPPLLAAPPERVRTLAGRLVVRLRRGAAAFTRLAEGMVPEAPASPVPAYRGDAPAADAPAGLGARARFPLPGSALDAELTLESQGPGRVALALRVHGGRAPGLSLEVREVQPDGTPLVARQTVRDGEAAIVPGLPPGPYLLEIRTARGAPCLRLRLDVEEG